MSSRQKTGTKPIRVLALFGANTRRIGGCEIYRVTMPFAQLREHPGFDTMWMPVENLPGVADKVGRFDIAVFPRHYVPEADRREIFKRPGIQVLVDAGIVSPDSPFPLIDMLRSQGVKIVYEVDDDLTNEHRQVIGTESDIALRFARACDAITVSTPYLKTMMHDKTGLPTYVCRNYIDSKVWSRDGHQRAMEGLTIGLSGSPTHEKDWQVLEFVLPAILERYPHVNLIIGGFHPQYLPPFGGQVQYIEPLPYLQYTGTLRSMDILLVPVDPNDAFNRSKSPIKALEGMAAQRLVNGKPAGCAVIATDMPVYRDAVIEGHNGLLVEHTAPAWEQALERVIVDHDLRSRLQLQAYRWVRKHRDIKTGWQDWRNAYHAILRR